MILVGIFRSARMINGDKAAAAEQPDGTQDFDVSTGKQWVVGSQFDYLDGRGSATCG